MRALVDPAGWGRRAQWASHLPPSPQRRLEQFFADASQPLPGPHGAHSPPQSTSLSRPFRTPSPHDGSAHLDRKSTRLNSSHLGISYAVFCLKKKKKKTHIYQQNKNTKT